MKITVTSTSTSIKDLLSGADYGILQSYYKDSRGAIVRNTGSNTIYIETGKHATSSDSYPIPAGAERTLACVRDLSNTFVATATGNSNLIIIF